MGTAKRTKPGSKKKPNKRWSEVLSTSPEVWHAGLGALAEAQDKGRIHFDNLVHRGKEIDRLLKIEAAAKKRDAVRKAVLKKGAPPPTSQELTREKLSLLFEQRVSEALSRLGVLRTAEAIKLTMRVENLAARLERISKRLAAIEGTKKEVKRKPIKLR